MTRKKYLYDLLPVISIIGLFLVFYTNSFSQTTKVRGRIIDSETKETIPFVNITFKGTNIGTITDFNGEYFLESRQPSDSVVISYVGYKQIRRKIIPDSYQVLNIEMEKDNIQLGEVVVLPGENPAHILLRKIIENKKLNDPERYDSYKYEAYNKLEFDINNISEEDKNSRILKKFGFIFDYIDTSVISGKTYLPIFISETLSDFYFIKNPKNQQEIIKANKISGVENESITHFTGDIYQKVNVYDNFIQIFGKGFVSPVSAFGRAYYKYYLIDSTFFDNQWCYQISFRPKRKQEPTFTGDFWVHDTTFAIKKIQVRIAEDANINFVNDMVVSHEYSRIDNKYWFLHKEEVFLDFNISDKEAGFFGRKTTMYKDVVINPRNIDDKFSGSYDITVNDSAREKSGEFWKNVRHEKLTQREEDIYAMVDSIKAVPVYKTIYDFVIMFTTGYYVWGPVELGTYYKTYSFNPVEGHRFRIGGRTSNDFSTKIMPEGYIAYGTKDEKIKYSAGFMYMFSTLPRRSMGFYYKHDYEQLGQSPNAFFHDNILSSVLRRNPNNKLSMAQEYKMYYEKEWFQGFSNTLYLIHKEIRPTEYIQLEMLDEQDNTYKCVSHLATSEIILKTRFAYKEDYLLGKFERVSLGSYYPIVNVFLTMGIKDLIGSEFEYYKLKLNVTDHFPLNPFGTFEFIIDAGKIWGRTPYPFLQLHEGNETYAFDDYAFNMMNYYEFVSDRYISVFAEQHFEGFFLNRIPLFRKLKWREVISGKGVIGSLDEENAGIMKFPLGLSGLSKPYLEASAGIENIFKFIRIDAMWRLSYLDNPDISEFGIRAQLQVDF